jgi:transcriptional regulator with XRE-family HTH domain
VESERPALERTVEAIETKRLAERGPTTDTATARAVCACGQCGMQVDKPGSRYRRGHHRRGMVRKGTPDECDICGGEFWVVPSQTGQRKTDSWWCRAASLRKYKPWNSLQRRCFRYMKDMRLLPAEFAASTGVSLEALETWFRRKGSTTSSELLSRLAALFGIPLDVAIQTAGGETAEDRHRRSGVEMAARNFAKPGSEEAKRQQKRASAAAKLKVEGRPQSDEHRRKRRESQRDSGALDRAIAGLRRANSSKENRAVQILVGHLLQDQSPTGDQIKLWAADAAVALGGDWTEAQMIDRWAPQLKKRGLVRLVRRGGRPPRAGRCELIEHLRSISVPNNVGEAQKGFWEHAAGIVSNQLSVEIDGPMLMYWFIHHRRACKKHAPVGSALDGSGRPSSGRMT